MKRVLAVTLLLMSLASVALADGPDYPPSAPAPVVLADGPDYPPAAPAVLLADGPDYPPSTKAVEPAHITV